MTKIGGGKQSATNNVNAVTRLRLSLLANGYTPLPNLNKICIYPNWPNVSVDEKFVRARNRDKKYQATGLRLQDGLTAIDNDSDDQPLVDLFSSRALVNEPTLHDSLIRMSRPVREAWFCRTDKAFGTYRSRRWLKPGEAKVKPRLMDQATWDLLSDEEREVQGKPKIHRLEVCSGPGKQFGAFGPHSHNADGTIKFAYSWEDDVSPATTPLAALPELSSGALGRLCDLFDECARELGFVELPAKLRPPGSTLYTLEPGMEIETLFDGIMTIEQARDWAGPSYDSEHRCSWSFDEPGHDNPTHCSVKYTKAHGLEIHVHGEELLYREADRKPPDTAELGAELAALSPDRAGPDDELEPGPMPMDDIVVDDNDSSVGFYNATAWLQAHYAFWPGGFHGAGAVVPIHARAGKADPLKVPSLKLMMKRYDKIEISERGTVKRISPVDLWMTLPTRITVAGTRMAPAETQPLYRAGGELMVNTYRRQRHTRLAGSLAAWDAFLGRLIPDALERAWFEQWMAYKWHHPEVPMVAVLMVARHQGTGRGTLFDIIGHVFGRHLTITVDFGSRTGSRSGSEFNEREAYVLFVFVNEAVEDDGHKFGKRRNAYDAMKERLDPSGSQLRMFMAKGQMPFWTEPVASTIIASNHGDAIKLPKDDRRVVVITNPTVEMTVAESDEIRAWMAKPENIGELARRLEATQHDRSAFNPYRAPMFQAKLDMIDLARTDIEDAWDQASSMLPADIFTMPQAIAAVTAVNPRAATGDYAQKMEWHIANASFRLREVDEPGYRFRYKGKRVVAFAKTEEARAWWRPRSTVHIAEELARNDDEASRRTILPFTPPKR